MRVEAGFAHDIAQPRPSDERDAAGESASSPAEAKFARGVAASGASSPNNGS